MNFLRKLHKWLGLIIGIQVVLWTVSGLVFAWLDHEAMPAHVAQAPEPALGAATIKLAEPDSWLQEYADVQVLSIRLMPLLDRWLWRVQTTQGAQLRDAGSGSPFAIDEGFARRMALASYRGAGKLEEVTLEAATLEARKAGPTWRARFDDSQGTTLYFAADDGRLVATRNSAWRVFDFFMMLHTMDYESRENFNHPLVITFTTGALWLALSGMLLLARSFRRRDFDFLRR